MEGAWAKGRRKDGRRLALHATAEKASHIAQQAGKRLFYGLKKHATFPPSRMNLTLIISYLCAATTFTMA